MSFGQIMPLLLLCLPFLAAGESYYDYLHKRYQHLSAALEYYDEHVKHGHIVTNSRPNSKEDTHLSITETPSHPQPADSNGVTMDLITAGSKYDQERSRIEKYFYADVHNLNLTKASRHTGSESTEVLQRKQSIATRYQSVEEFEKHIDVTPAVVFFVFNVVLASALGVLLNTGNGIALEVCIGLGVLSISSQTLVSAKAP